MPPTVRPEEAVPRMTPILSERPVDRDQGVNVPQPVTPLQDFESPEGDVEQSGQQEVVIGCAYHGREEPGLEKLIGHFVNFLAMRLQVHHGCKCTSFLQSICGIKEVHLPRASRCSDTP